MVAPSIGYNRGTCERRTESARGQPSPVIGFPEPLKCCTPNADTRGEPSLPDYSVVRDSEGASLRTAFTVSKKSSGLSE